MSVEVRLFASLRDAAGTARTTSDAATVADLVRELTARYGEPFGARLARSTVIVDGDPVVRTASEPLPDGAEVALLPPFSGGS